MHHYLKLPSIVLLAVATLLGACSSTPTANMDFDPAFNFSTVKTVAIQPFNRTLASTVVVSDMQVSRINATLTDELTRRGYQVVTDNAEADLLLSWHLVTQERTDVRSFNSSTRYNCWNCPSSSNISVRQYTQGTFIVDMIDPQRLQAVWRSIFESRLRDQPDPQRAAQNRQEAAQAIFADFPPK